MSIPDQSHANPVPIRFQSRAKQMPYQGHSLDQPRINLIHFFANPGQSMPILANPMPISGQSVTSYVLNHRTSPLYGMVPSPLGGWIKANSPVIDWQVIGTGPNPFQSMPILTNPVPISGQSVPVHANQRSIFTKTKVVNCPICANPSKSNANPGQSNANFMLLLRPFVPLT